MNHPTTSLSFSRIALAQLYATTLAAILWVAGALVGGYGTKIALIGAAQSGVLLIVSITILVLFTPSKQRPIATLATLWSATSFARFLAALGASCLLYYAAQFGFHPMMFSFLLAAIFLLIAETRIITLTLLEYSAEAGSLTKD